MGMALTSCTVPQAGKPTFELGDDEMEIGIGIHGEPGRERACRWRRRTRSSRCWRRRSSTTCPSSRGDKVLAFVNGMGGTPLIELYIVYNELARAARGRGITHRAQPGRHLHHLARHGRLLDHPARAGRRAHRAVGRAGRDAGPAVGRVSADGRRVAPALRRGGLGRGCAAFAAAVAAASSDHLTELDAAIGDADHGINMDRGMQAVLAKLDDGGRPRRGGVPPPRTRRTRRPRASARCSRAIGMTLVSTVGGAAGRSTARSFCGWPAAAGDASDARRWRTGPRRSRPAWPACRRAARPSRRQDHDRRAGAGGGGAAAPPSPTGAARRGPAPRRPRRPSRA